MSESVSQELLALNPQSAVGSPRAALVQREALGRDARERVDLDEQSVPGLRDVLRPFIAEQIAQRIPDDGEEGNEQRAGRAIGIVRDDLAGDQPEMSTAFAGEVEDRLDRQREHRSLHELAALRSEHRSRFRVLSEEALVDQRREIRAAQGRAFKAPFDRIGGDIHRRKRHADKKRAGP